MATSVGRLGAAVALALVCLSALLGALALGGDAPVERPLDRGRGRAAVRGRRRPGVPPAGAASTASPRNATPPPARLEALIEGTSDLVLVTDAAGLVTYASPASRRILGLEPGDLTGNLLSELVRQAEAPLVREAVDRLNRTADVELTLELAMSHVDGGARLLECRVRALDAACRTAC